MAATIDTGDETCWYVIHTLMKQEDRAEANLRAWQVPTFLPRVKEARRNPYTGQTTYFVKPLFPRYIFARFDVSNSLHKIKYTRGVRSVVSFGADPTPVNETIISALEARIGQDGYARLYDKLDSGDEVAITDGPLKGLAGIFERDIKGSDRALILLKAIAYQAHVQVEKDFVKKPERQDRSSAAAGSQKA